MRLQPQHKQILIVEDDVSLSYVLGKHMEKINLKAKIVHDGQAGLVEIMRSAYDLVILDIGLPSMNGLTLMQRARQQGARMPMIIITSKPDDQKELSAYRGGANLFHSKPVNFELLLEQVRTLVELSGATNIIEIGDLYIDKQKRVVKKEAGELIELTFKEFELLKLLVSSPGDVFSRDEIMQKTFKGIRDIEQGSVDTLVSRLRRKLGEYQGQSVVETVHSVGFRLSLGYLQSLEKDN